MATTKKKWSARVTKTSDAMDVASGTFQSADPKKIAETVEHDAEKSTRRKSTPYRSAMSMLTFYINRAGKNLSAKQLKVLEDAKMLLREEFGPKSTAKAAPAKRKAAKKTPSGPKKVAKKKAAGRKASAKR